MNITRALAIAVSVAAALAAPDARGAAERFQGVWTRISSQLTVRVTSWGDNCGPSPKSYSNNTPVDVEIAAQGRHLVFTKGGLRTDRCSSANPKITTRNESVSDNRWERTCETPPDDSKYEKDEYTYIATGENKIEYRAASDYDWTLNGDHCVLHIDETRVFVRSSKTPASPPKGGESAPKPKSADPAPAAEDAVASKEPACSPQGPAKKLLILPKSARMGPGERVCFQAFGVDESGCRFPAEAQWSAEQNGIPIPGLLARTGCFSAGATAAESEGSYLVVAQHDGKKAVAEANVVFPDFGALKRVRLDPGGDVDGGGSPTELGNPVFRGAPPMGGGEGQPSSGRVVAAIVAAAIGLLAAVVALVVAVRWRSRAARSRATASDEDDDGENVGRRRKDQPPPAMVCPKCHRSYDAEGRFCPHDASKLLPYAEWRHLQRGAK